MPSIKINRAIAAARIGAHPACAHDMLEAIPAKIVKRLPARLLAEMLDANWALAQASKALANKETCEFGAVWDSRTQRLRDIAP